MSEKDDLIQAQNQLIGVLFEIIKRYSENSTLDEEYFSLVMAGRDKHKIEDIRKQRRENSRIIVRLLAQLEN